MVAIIGVILIGSHFCALVVLAEFCAEHVPHLGLVVFLTGSVLSGLFLMRIQTRIEVYFIKQHLKKRPDSGWRVIDTAKGQLESA